MVLEEQSRAVWVSADAEVDDESSWEMLEEAYLEGRRGQLVSYDSVNGAGVAATMEALEDAGLSSDEYELISKKHRPEAGTGLLRSSEPGVQVRTVDETGYGPELRLEGEQKTSI